jgi:hypothetical protein
VRMGLQDRATLDRQVFAARAGENRSRLQSGLY